MDQRRELAGWLAINAALSLAEIVDIVRGSRVRFNISTLAQRQTALLLPDLPRSMRDNPTLRKEAFMKALATVVVCLFAAGVGGPTLAQSCPTGTTEESDVQTFVAGKTLCATIPGGDRWQEYHSGAGGGPLIDFKKGAGDAVDPTETVGTWSVTSNNLLTHTYSASLSYAWRVCRVGSSSVFTLVSSTAGTITGATFQAGSGPCP